tara:strand:+ start:51 stop:317 length:267 start_codon:yes stop_codon:yes gene_type:complete
MTKKNPVPFPYLQNVRKIKGLTQLDVGNKVGIKNTVVSQIETGYTSLPPQRMGSWARTLGVPLDEFSKEVLKQYHPEFYAGIFLGEIK